MEPSYQYTQFDRKGGSRVTILMTSMEMSLTNQLTDDWLDKTRPSIYLQSR